MARASVAEGERRAAESEAGGLNVELSDNPLQAASQIRGIFAGIIMLISFFMCTGMGIFGFAITAYYDGEIVPALGAGLVGLLMMATPLLYAFSRARRAGRAGRGVEPPSYR